MIFVFCGGNEIKDGWWPLSTKESAHESTNCACGKLSFLVGRYLNAITEENEIYAEENKSDSPYVAEENEYYENDNNFDYSGLNEDTEYEEDDISLFSVGSNQESRFDNIDDDIYSSIQTQQEDDFEYSETVNGLDEKIDSLDKLDDASVSDVTKIEEQDAESFMNELNKYKEEVEDDEFIGFTTSSSNKAEVEEDVKRNIDENDIVPENINLQKNSVESSNKKNRRIIY